MLAVRELQYHDIPLLLQYWFNADHSFLTGMGVDVSKLPPQNEFAAMLEQQIQTPIEQKRAYCIIWEMDGKAIGHCNTNPTTFGEEAKMHLHLWHSAERQKGIGTSLVKMTLPYFFSQLQLKILWCEPYALNHAPNKALQKAGFEFVREYITVPGSINFEQPVKQWKMMAEQFKKINMQM